MRAAVYARLSRKKAEEELGLNISDQQAIGLELVAHRGWTLIQGTEPNGTFTDDGVGAYNDANRPGWKALLASEPDVVVVRDAARLYRNWEDHAALLRTKARVVEWLDEDGSDEDLDAPLQHTDTEAFGTKTVGNRAYSQKVSKGVKRKLKTKAAKGYWPHGGTRPFGYHHPPKCCEEEDCAPGVIKADEARVIQEAAIDWLDGKSLSRICRELTDAGVVTPKGKPWQYARLRAMLSGPRVAGIRTHNGVEHTGQWDAIINMGLHQALKTAASESMVKRANASGTYLLTGVAWCGACADKKMYGHRVYGKKGSGAVRLRYICREGCGQGIALPLVDEFVVNRSLLAMLAPQLRDDDEARRDLATYLAQIKDYKQSIQDLDDAYWQQKAMDKDRWLAQSAAFTKSLGEAQSAAAEMKARLSSKRDLPATAAELAARWQAADTPERTRLLRAGVDRVVIAPPARVGRFDPTRIEIHFRDGRVEGFRGEGQEVPA